MCLCVCVCVCVCVCACICMCVCGGGGCLCECVRVWSSILREWKQKCTNKTNWFNNCDRFLTFITIMRHKYLLWGIMKNVRWDEIVKGKFSYLSKKFIPASIQSRGQIRVRPSEACNICRALLVVLVMTHSMLRSRYRESTVASFRSLICAKCAT